MAKCTLDLTHPSFLKSIRKCAGDPAFDKGLRDATAKIENEHSSCNRVTQDGMGKYPQCVGKIWKYDWAPEGQRSRNRKCWRMVAICPDPQQQPYHLIAAGVYEKRATEQFSARELAQVYAEIMAPQRGEKGRVPDEYRYNRSIDVDGTIRSVCLDCASMVITSPDEGKVGEAELQHECEPY